MAVDQFKSIISSFLSQYRRDVRYEDAHILYGWENLEVSGKVRGNELSVTSSVPSFSDRDKRYRVEIEVSSGSIRFHCQCQDYRYRKKPCKHIIAVMMVLEDPLPYHTVNISRLQSKVKPFSSVSTPDDMKIQSIDDLNYF